MLDASDGGGYRSPMRPAPAFPEIAVVDLKVCDRCGLCLPLCPPEAIHLALTDLVVDRSTCTGCRKCIAPCPVGALTMVPARARRRGRGRCIRSEEHTSELQSAVHP